MEGLGFFFLSKCIQETSIFVYIIYIAGCREGANGSVPEMYSRVKASAAMVASSLPTASGASSPYHSSFPMPRQTEGGEAVSKPPGVPAGGAAEGPSRQSGATEIFRTNRHSSLGSASRQVGHRKLFLPPPPPPTYKTNPLPLPDSTPFSAL